MVILLRPTGAVSLLSDLPRRAVGQGLSRTKCGMPPWPYSINMITMLMIQYGTGLADSLNPKHVFSPDLHPERMDFILQHVMNQPGINVSHG